MKIDGMEVKFNYDKPSKEPLIKDVVGTGQKFIKDITSSINDKLLFEHVGIQPNKTFLLEGEPGTGKTYSIKALNNTFNKGLDDKIEDYLNKETDEVPIPNVFFMSYDIGKYGTAYINRGSRIVQSFFDTAYFFSLQKPVVLVFDEADALFNSRKSMISATREDYKVLETIMKNLQIAHDTNNMYVVLMTNFRDMIDQAVLRAGRIDKKYHFELPSIDDRIKLFENIINKYCERAGYKVIRNYDSEELAMMSDGFNGADIVSVVEKALRTRVTEVSNNKQKGIIPALYVTDKRIKKEINNHKRLFKEKKYKIGF